MMSACVSNRLTNFSFARDRLAGEHAAFRLIDDAAIKGNIGSSAWQQRHPSRLGRG